MKTRDGSTLSSPPDVDEIEVSVFGPGFGESIVAHLTGGDWVTIDSCLDKETGTPSAAQYFATIGVDPEKDVRFVIATHWHDDHVQGIGRLFETCKSAKFVCAYGLHESQFKSLIELYRRFFGPGGSGVDEFTKVMQMLKSRRKRGIVIGPEFAAAGTIIYESSDSGVLLKALAPSSAAVAAAIAKFAEQILPREDQKRFRVPSLGPNDLAVVITLRVGEVRVLLGADLEQDGREGIGWREVVSRFGKIDRRHEGIKIPHHGSVTGHNDDLWLQMLIPQPWAVITPYSRMKPPLPTPSDIQRIARLSPDVYLTAQKRTSRFNHRYSAVRKQLAEMNVVISEYPATQGLVRMRKKTSHSNSEWSVELFGDAAKVQ